MCEIAEETFRAESSLRWLIKQIHAKLGISWQAALVRLVLSGRRYPDVRTTLTEATRVS